jgi:hypothetical protein
MSKEPMYVIPARYRRMENMHIIFWLLKDVSWCMIWKTLGVAMIFPTLIISIIIAYRTKEIRSELAHNLAITFWITANSYWMISEFFGFDETPVAWGFEGKHISIIPFAIGVLVLVYYYLFQRRSETQVAVADGEKVVAEAATL